MPGPVSKLLISMTDLWLFWQFGILKRHDGMDWFLRKREVPKMWRSLMVRKILNHQPILRKLNSCLITEFPTWSESLWSIWISWIWQIDQDPYYFSHVEGDIDEILSISDLGKVQRPHLVLRNVWEATSGTPLKSPTLLTGVMGILFVMCFFCAVCLAPRFVTQSNLI